MQDKFTIDVPGLDWRIITRLDMHLEIGRPTQHSILGDRLNILSFLLFSFFSPAHPAPDTVAQVTVPHLDDPNYHLSNLLLQP